LVLVPEQIVALVALVITGRGCTVMARAGLVLEQLPVVVTTLRYHVVCVWAKRTS
jgi:hypothetical protein